MSDFANLASKIRQQFVTAWALTEFADLPYFFDGQDIGKDDIENRTWLRVSVEIGESTQVAMGGGASGRRVRTVGVAMVRIFKPSGGGHGELYRIADSVASVWQLGTIDCVLYRAAAVQPVQTDGPWTILPVNTPFQADEYVA